MAADPTVLATIRSVAEQYVAEYLPDEHPYFSMIWEKYAAGKEGGEPALRAAPSFSCSLSFGKSRKLDLVAPAVILTIEATIAELGTSLSECSEDDMQTAISEAAKALGASAKAAKQMAKKIAPALHKEYVSTFLSYEPHASEAMQVREDHSPEYDSGTITAVGQDTFVVWTPAKSTLGSQEDNGLTQDQVEDRYLSKRNDYDIVIFKETIMLPSQDRKLSLPAPFMATLITLLHYKGLRVNADIIDIKRKSPDKIISQDEAYSADQDTTPELVRPFLKRFRKRLRTDGLDFIDIPDRRTHGYYTCAGRFSYCVIIKQSDRNKYSFRS